MFYKHIRSKALFKETRFGSEANFFNAEFHSEANFFGAKFDSLANFGNAKFKKLILTNCILPELLIFEGISTNEIIDLTTTYSPNIKYSIETYEHISTDGPKICRINLIDAPIEKFKIRYDKFRVYKPDHIPPEMYEKLTNVYEGLLKNFKDHGYLTSYETLDKEYQEFKFTKKPKRNFLERTAGTSLNWLNKNWNDYGYDKVRIWYITGLFFIIFAFINWLRFPHLISKVYSISTIKEVFDENKNFKRQWADHGEYSIVNFHIPFSAIYYTALIFFGFKLSIEKMNFRYPFSVFYIFLQFTIGLICLAYLANFVISSTLIGS